MKEVAILGAGGHTRSSITLLKSNLPYRQLNIYDESFSTDLNEIILEVPLIGKPRQINENAEVFLSIGDNQQRRMYYEKYSSQLLLENLIHHLAYVENTVRMGVANQIYANVYVNNAVNIGNNNIINTSAILEHEVTLGSHNHIAVGAKLCGRVTLGNQNFIGCGAILIDKIKVCDDVVIGAGAVIIEDIVESGTYVGIPGKKIK